MKPIVIATTLLFLNSCCAFNGTCPAEPAPSPAAAKTEVGYKVIPLKYAAADDLAKALRASIATEAGHSPPKIVADERTNSLIVSCAPEELGSIEQLITALDVEVKQAK